MRKYIAFVVCCIAFLAFGQAEAATRSMCPDKVLDTNTVEGIFLGVECEDSCSGTIKLPTGEDFSFFMSEEQAEEAFGESTGQKVSVTYEVQQFWRVEDPDGDINNGWCQRSEVFVSGKLLTAAPSAKTATPGSIAKGPIDDHMVMSPLSDKPSNVTMKDFMKYFQDVSDSEITWKWEKKRDDYYLLHGTIENPETKEAETVTMAFSTKNNHAILAAFIDQHAHQYPKEQLDQMIAGIAAMVESK